MPNENLYDPTLREWEKAFLHYLHARGAKYVVIGGHAVLLYVDDRDSGVNDLDVVIECSSENAVKVYEAVQDYTPGLISEQQIDVCEASVNWIDRGVSVRACHKRLCGVSGHCPRRRPAKRPVFNTVIFGAVIAIAYCILVGGTLRRVG